MLDKWNVFISRDYVGVLTYDTATTMFSLDYKGTTPLAERTRCLLNWDKEPERFKATLFNRVCPSDRVDIRDILRMAGLTKYDAWELIKCCNLNTITDTIWMQKGTDPNKFYEMHWAGPDCKAIGI